MYQLRGEYECSVDAKGRLRLPSGLLRQFGGSGSLSFVVNRGFEKCIMLYPKEVWDRKAAEARRRATPRERGEVDVTREQAGEARRRRAWEGRFDEG